jgi:hypothetical protein
MMTARRLKAMSAAVQAGCRRAHGTCSGDVPGGLRGRPCRLRRPGGTDVKSPSKLAGCGPRSRSFPGWSVTFAEC